MRNYVELFTVLLAEAKDRGFGIYGICMLVDRLIQKEVFNPAEGEKIHGAIQANRPKDIPASQAYFWPNNSEYTPHRLEFINKLLNAYTQHFNP